MKPDTSLVIGSNCFTGSHIVNGLLSEFDGHVHGVSRSEEYDDIFLSYRYQDDNPDRFTFHQVDIVRQNDELARLLERIQPELVVNVAALSQVNLSHFQPVEYYEVNTTAVAELAHHLRRSDYLKQYVHISSAEVYGTCEEPVDETSPFHPSTPYAVSKAAADMHIQTVMDNFDFPATIVRSTNVYGRHQQLHKIIPRTVIYDQTDRTLELHGGGTSVKPFVHVRDVVDGILRTVRQEKTGPFNFTTHTDPTVAEIVQMTCELMDVNFDEFTEPVGDRLAQDDRYWLDDSKARNELNWEPTTTLRDGIREVIDWIEDEWDIVKNKSFEYQHKL